MRTSERSSRDGSSSLMHIGAITTALSFWAGSPGLAPVDEDSLPGGTRARVCTRPRSQKAERSIWKVGTLLGR
eukprot:5791036-Prymnesium_polylepis.2